MERGWPDLFAAAFRQSRNAMALLDADRRFIDVNGACINLTGHPRGRLLGRHAWEIVAGPPAFTQREWIAFLRRADQVAIDVRLRRGDGVVVRVQWAATVERATGRQRVLAVALSTALWGDQLRPPVRETFSEPLSPREREVVALVAGGASGPEIAEELHVAHNTVRTHVRHAMEKTGARSRAHLVAKALGDGAVLR